THDTMDFFITLQQFVVELRKTGRQAKNCTINMYIKKRKVISISIYFCLFDLQESNICSPGNIFPCDLQHQQAEKCKTEIQRSFKPGICVRFHQKKFTVFHSKKQNYFYISPEISSKSIG